MATTTAPPQNDHPAIAGDDAFRLLFERHPQPMWVFDEDTLGFLEVNDAAVATYGYRRDEFLAMTMLDMGPAEDAPATRDAVRSVAADDVYVGHGRHLLRDGFLVDVEVHARRTTFGGRRAWLVVVTDVSDRRQADVLQRLQQATFDASPEGIVITDASGHIRWVNAAFTRMTGWTLPEVHGSTPRVLRSGRHDPAFYAEIWRTILAGKVWRGEIVNRRKDGSLYTEEETIAPVVMSDGRIRQFVALKRDVTESRRLADALHRREAQFRALVEHSLDIVLLVDAAGVVRYASPSIARVLGLDPASVIGRSAFEHVHPDDVERLRALFTDRVGVSGETARAEYRARHASGAWRTMEAVGQSTILDAGGHGAVVTARDITERRQAEAEQSRLREHLSQSEKLAALGELLAGVAHELNNPLSVVTGYAALLTNDAAPAVAARAEKIRQAAERCARIVRNFLAVARQHPQERERVAVARVVNEVLELLAYPLRVDTVSVSVDLPDDLPAVWADPHQLHQVLLNLITNAHHAVRGSAGPRHIVIGARADGPDAIQVEVVDSGPGIPPEVEARIFDPFFTTKPVGQGTGLGLPICKGLVEAHGGSLEVEGRPGRGACFRLRLPLGQPPPSQPPAATATERGQGQRVLVVDDEPHVGQVLSDILTVRGYQVDLAGNGRIALERLAARPYDVILSDVRMPELDGPGLYRELERRAPAMLPRFVFMTGDTLNPLTNQVLEGTRGPFLKKPFTLDEVAAAIRQVLDAAAPAGPASALVNAA
jgi:nitrogen fixation negative regulator NifL